MVGTVVTVDSGSVGPGGTIAGIDTGAGAVDTTGRVVAVDAGSTGPGLAGGTNGRSVTADAINSSSLKMLLSNGNMPLTAKPDLMFTGVAAIGSATAAIPGMS